MPEATLNVGALYGTVDRKRREAEWSWRELAKDLDLSPSTFTRMGQGARPDADALTTLMQWLKMDLREFTSSDEASSSDEPEIPVAVASLLRSSSKIKPEQIDALDEAFSVIYRSIVGKGE